MGEGGGGRKISYLLKGKENMRGRALFEPENPHVGTENK